jgi:TolB-like protein/Tfp pilus assembly protein PilF
VPGTSVRLWAELHERRVIRVAVAYAIAAWMVVEVMLSVAPALRLPAWTGSFVVVLALLGFVPALGLAWAFDLTPAGIRRASSSQRATSAHDATGEPDAPAVTERHAVVAMPASGSIAVLPFVNFSAQAENEYFSDGITEELIDRLARVRGLRVAARTSSFAFKGRNADIAEIARQLRVAYILEGSVRRAGDRLRVTAQLIDAESGFHLWSDSFDRAQADVFAIQDEIGCSIVAALSGALAGQGLALEPHRAATVSPQAWDLYLQGRYLLNRRTAASIRSAIERFELALACSPAYARAHAGLAEAWLVLGSGTYAVMPAREALIRARTSAARAVELDPSAAEAHTALGLARMYAFDWEGSRSELQLATQLDPGGAAGHYHYAWRLAMTCEFDDAFAAADRAFELDPLSLNVRVVRGRILQFMRRPEEAVAEYRSILELDPGFAGAHFAAGVALIQAGRSREAVAALQRARELSDTPATAGLLAYALGAAGDIEEGRVIVADLLRRSRREYVSPITIGGAYLGLGEHEAALDYYELAWAERSPGLIYLAVEPLLDPLRRDPRFESLCERVGLCINGHVLRPSPPSPPARERLGPAR